MVKENSEKETTINFTVSNCPLSTFKLFGDFCKLEASHNYSFGLKLLLEARETNANQLVLYEQYLGLRDEVEQLKKQVKKIGSEQKHN